MTKPTHSDDIFLRAITHRQRCKYKCAAWNESVLGFFFCFSPLAESVSSRLKLTQGVNLLFCQFPDVVPPPWIECYLHPLLTLPLEHNDGKSTKADM